MKTNGMKLKAQSSKLNETSQDPASRSGIWRGARSDAWSLILLLSFALCLLSVRAVAVLPEPDNILYGTIALEGRAIGAADYDVTIVARRTPTGPAIARYQMGNDPRAGNFYSLRIPLESFTPKTDADSALAGEVIYIVITDYSGDRETRQFTVGQRGAFTRVDIGIAVPDSDSDGLPDAWELAVLGNLHQDGNADLDGDGRSNLQEYFAGTNPNSAENELQLSVTSSATRVSVSFFALQAQGPGYEGLARRYSLQYSTNLGESLWFDLPGYSSLLGNNTTITYQSPAVAGVRFYRSKAWLQSQ